MYALTHVRPHNRKAKLKATKAEARLQQNATEAAWAMSQALHGNSQSGVTDLT